MWPGIRSWCTTMPFRYLLLLCLLLPLGVRGAVMLEASWELNYLDEGMHEAFELGQRYTVTAIYETNQVPSVIDLYNGEQAYRFTLESLTLSIPDVGFVINTGGIITLPISGGPHLTIQSYFALELNNTETFGENPWLFGLSLFDAEILADNLLYAATLPEDASSISPIQDMSFIQYHFPRRYLRGGASLVTQPAYFEIESDIIGAMGPGVDPGPRIYTGQQGPIDTSTATLNVTMVPEPSTTVLVLAAAGLLLALTRRHRA